MCAVQQFVFDAVLGEIDARFSKRDGKLMTALTALDPRDDSFLDATKVKAILDLVRVEIVQTQNTVAREFLLSQIAPEDNWTIQKVLSKHSYASSNAYCVTGIPTGTGVWCVHCNL